MDLRVRHTKAASAQQRCRLLPVQFSYDRSYSAPQSYGTTPKPEVRRLRGTQVRPARAAFAMGRGDSNQS